VTNVFRIIKLLQIASDLTEATTAWRLKSKRNDQLLSLRLFSTYSATRHPADQYGNCVQNRPIDFLNFVVNGD